MAFTDIPDPIETKLTENGRILMARASIGEVVFKLVGFAIGSSGYLNSNPVHIIPVDDMATTLLTQVAPTTGQKEIHSFEKPLSNVVVVNCVIDPVDINLGLGSAIGEIGVWAEIISSNLTPEIGSRILFALGHCPIVVFNHRVGAIFRVIITL